MEKLIELLNECKPNQWNKNLEPIWCDIYHMPCWDSIEHCIISKSYGFIKWLVENKKVDLDGIPYLTDEYWWGFDEYEELIMILSIQDSPIEFLVSILL